MCPAGWGRGHIVKGPPKVPAHHEMLSDLRNHVVKVYGLERK